MQQAITLNTYSTKRYHENKHEQNWKFNKEI